MLEENSDTNSAEEPASHTEETQPLSNLRILDLGNIVAASYCNRMLADFGAEIIKIG